MRTFFLLNLQFITPRQQHFYTWSIVRKLDVAQDTATDVETSTVVLLTLISATSVCDTSLNPPFHYPSNKLIV